MAWVLLLIAGLLEVVWAFTMKLSQGFTAPSSSASSFSVNRSLPRACSRPCSSCRVSS